MPHILVMSGFATVQIPVLVPYKTDPGQLCLGSFNMQGVKAQVEATSRVEKCAFEGPL